MPLAIEGLMAFFLEASFVGLFFFGWDRLSEVGYLTATWLVALGTNLSALWETQPAPASFTVFGIPDRAAHTTRYAVEVPWVLGLIATRSFDQEVSGIKPLVAANQNRIRSGMLAFDDMTILHIAEYDEDISEGTGHKGMSALIDLVARK